ncbi:RpiR family transcriptional regulator [Bradyrhizobium canariense]|uniref:RpiR family transcriptional regulator n=1 Tax=Bradyrhizobium canariense TaxID=255045 RepID=A0A1X3G8A6_9BRAD|nr:RpiR family transcriptional regulator [Bradyrhizobium canariense]OSI82514.1 RpiR family transcriptional regulator [Bradyrhizobium canariense]OSI96995.1 RpiR family transcriptional regulator [Bradyrhizobium canariense]OSI99650.1 RpiR family transcriptional regulator [Bradyrhizobium canariense]OSJ16730.1 RpiR family transcriptional regulator [Bradyrhizobium canariense]
MSAGRLDWPDRRCRVGSADLVEEIKEICVDLSGHAVDAAHYLINNPDEAAFHSMREIARRANVPPVSLVRLAQRMGLPGYGELRQRFIDTMRDRQQRDRLSTTRNEQTAQVLIHKMGEGARLHDIIESFFAAELNIVRRARAHLSEEKVTEAVGLLAKAPKIFVCGRRTTFTPAYTLAYALRKARPNVILLDNPGGAPESLLDDLLPGDAFVAVTFAPFNRVVHRLAQKAAQSGGRIISITDSFAAPVSELEGLHFVAQTSGQAFPESTLGAIAIANLLAALAIGRLGAPAQARIRENEQFLHRSGEYILSGKVTKRRLPLAIAASRKPAAKTKRKTR